MPSPDGTSEPAAAVSALHCREDLPHPTPCRYAVLFSSRPFLCGRNHTADRSGYARVMRNELKKRGIKKLKVVYSKEKPITPIEDMAIRDRKSVV